MGKRSIRSEVESSAYRMYYSKFIGRMTIILLVTFIISGVLVYSVFKERQVLERKREELNKVNEEIQTMNNTKESLVYEISKLKDEDYIMELARKNYYFSKEGEILFILDEKSDGE
ncbi:MAG: FtsB family cell division protein [Bacilli bacterium]